MGIVFISYLDQMYFQYNENTTGVMNKLFFLCPFKCCKADKGKGIQSFCSFVCQGCSLYLLQNSQWD